MWGNLLESLGNFVTGRGFNNNKTRNNIDAQKKATTTTTTVGVQRPVSTARSLNTPLFNNPLSANLSPSNPTVSQPLFADPFGLPKNPNINTPEMKKVNEKIRNTGTAIPYAPKLINAVESNPNNYKGHDLGGLNNDSRVQVKQVIDNVKAGTDLRPIINSAKVAQESKAKSDWQNSIPGKIVNTALQIPRTIAGQFVDAANFITRIPQTIQTAGNVLKVNTIDQLPGMEQQKARDIAKGARITKAYDDIQKALAGATDFVAGMPLSTNEDTTRQAEAISTGKGTFGDFLGAGLNSLGAAMTIVGGVKWVGRKVDASQAKGIVSELNAAIQNNDTAAFRAAAAKTGDDNTIAYLNKIADNQDAINMANGSRAPKAPVANVIDGVATKTTVNPIKTPTPAVSSVDGSVPAKPQAVVALDAGGSVSAPVRTPAISAPIVPSVGNSLPAVTSAPVAPTVPALPIQPSLPMAPTTKLNAVSELAPVEAPVIKAPSAVTGTEPITAPSSLLISHEGAPDLKTVAEYKAQIQAGQPIDPIKVIREGDKYGIEDGKHRFQAYQELGIKEIPIEIVEAPSPKTPAVNVEKVQTPIEQASEIANQVAVVPAETKLVTADGTPFDPTQSKLGSVVQSYVQAGGVLDDASVTDLASSAAEMANNQAKELGTTFESIMDRYHKLWESKNKKTPAQVGLSDAEYNIAKDFVNEQNYLRNRADPSLITGGSVKNYAPRQYVGTEYTPDLVNEMHRAKNSSLTHSELDLTTTPIEQAIRRYGNAEKVVQDSVIDLIENKIVKNPNGVDERVETGIKVPEEAKANFSDSVKKYIAKKDEIEVALAKSELGKGEIDKLSAEMNQAIDDGFSQLIENIPKNAAEGKEVIARLTSQRGAYIQGTIRSNMFSNIVNRAIDQVQATILKSTNTLINISDSVSAKVLGNQKAFATGRDARSVAREYSKGALKNQISQDFRTNMTLAGKGLGSKIDVGYRAGSTALTSAGDLTTQTVRMANMMTLARAQAEGVTGRANLEAYLRKSLNSPEYAELLQGAQDAYAGYVSLPTSLGSRIGHEPKIFSKIDNVVNNGLRKLGVSPRISRELNDLIMPALSGFSGAVYRVGAKSANAMLGGVPGIIKGMKVIKQGGDASRQIGQMMIARSLIDGVIAGGAATLSTAVILNNVADWTGEYPSDPNERSRWEKDGIVPNAISIDNGDGTTTQIQPGRFLGAFALPVVMPMVIANGGDVGDIFDATMGQMLENMGAENILKNAGYISSALTGNEQQKKYARERLMASAGYSISNVVPASGFVNNVASGTDEFKRDTSGGIIDTMKSRVPGLRQDVPVKTDKLGNPIRNNAQGSLGSSLITKGNNGNPTSETASSLDGEITRLAKADFEVMPANTVKSKNSTAYGNLLLKSDIYKSASDEDKADMLHEVLLGTTTKAVNNNLGDSEKQALIEYRVQSEAQREVWLEDNNNAFNYYQSHYNNEKANGTLTVKDQDMKKTGSLAQKVAIAGVNQKYDVPQDIIRGYDNTSKTQFNDLEDGSEEKKMLMAYDQALVEAGLPSKYQNATGGYGKSGGSSGYGSISFAKPLTASDSASIKSQSLATVADPFSNIVKSAPNAKTNLKRNISVNKGVRL